MLVLLYLVMCMDMHTYAYTHNDVAVLRGLQLLDSQLYIIPKQGLIPHSSAKK